MTKMEELEAQALKIPHMGGRRIGPFLRRTARDADAGTSIVELGCWLGAGTAQMALGIRERAEPSDIAFHVYDNFSTSKSSAEKAQMQGYPDVREGDDTLQLVQSTLEPFGVDIQWHQGMLGPSTEWSGGPISVYVDDATKYPHTFYHCIKLFGPSWIPGKTVILLMDYYLFRLKKDVDAKLTDRLRCQYDFVEAHKSSFEHIEGFTDSSVEAFIYREPLDFASLPSPAFPKPR